jgi:acetyl esterase
MTMKPAPGYRAHLLSFYHGDDPLLKKERETALKKQGTPFVNLAAQEGMTIEDLVIPGPDREQKLKLRVFRPAGLPAEAPVVIDIHGGGWVAGNLDIDNTRCMSLAKETPCLVLSVDYRLSGDTVHFPAPLMDCLTAFLWAGEHAGELGGDTARIALHGTSAGGNLAGGLALYLRDKYNIRPALTIMNCPVISLESGSRNSARQYAEYSPDKPGEPDPAYIYLGETEGGTPSYYAFPGYCPDLSGLGPHAVVAGEYDALRDEGFEYAAKLLNAGVPCELMVAPRVGHAFCGVDAELTRRIHGMLCYSLRREFGMYEEN